MTREEIIEQYPIALAEKEGKQIQYYCNGKWIDCSASAIYGQEKLRIKPKPTKRLPTIEEVEEWFLENRVFVYKKNGVYNRIMALDKSNNNGRAICIDEWMSIEYFCISYTNLDGSELYITENEKQKLTYGGEIADFPVEIVERMLECQVEQGNTRDVSMFEKCKGRGRISYGFDWGNTNDGKDFWNDVINKKNFDLFFQKYPKKQ